MPEDQPLLIRADGGDHLGSGHVMRMLALVQALQDRGARPAMASVLCPQELVDRVRREGCEFSRLKAKRPGDEEDVRLTVSLAASLKARWVVLDGYHFGTLFQRALREAGVRVLAVDDYGHCDTWAADAVLNQNIFASERRYSCELGTCRCLLGTDFALLRREFRREAEEGVSFSHQSKSGAVKSIRRLLLTLGGVDADNVTGRVLEALTSLSERLEIKLLVGAANPHWGALQRQVAGSRHKIELLRNVHDMPPLYHWAEGVISAGGSTCWEWLFYGLPAAVVCLADNQRPVIAGLVKHGLAVDLGWHTDIQPETASGRLEAWLQCRTAPGFQVGSSRIVDGLGADRVASLLDGSQVSLRRARQDDARLWFGWANDPAVRANGFYPEPIPWEAHAKWFEHHRQSSESRLWLGFDLDQHPLGYVRLHRRGAREWEVGVAVAPEHRGRGFGRELVRLGIRQFAAESRYRGNSPAGAAAPQTDRQALTQDPVIVAQVKPGNQASLALFRSLGFLDEPARSSLQCCVLTRKAA